MKAPDKAADRTSRRSSVNRSSVLIAEFGGKLGDLPFPCSCDEAVGLPQITVHLVAVTVTNLLPCQRRSRVELGSFGGRLAWFGLITGCAAAPFLAKRGKPVIQRLAPSLRSFLVRGAFALGLLGMLSAARLCVADDGGENQPDWRTFELGNSGDLFVKILVKRRATMADRDWLMFEFENRASEPVVLRNPHYHTRRTCYHLANGKAANFSSLASGNPYDMFPEAWRTTPVSPITVKPGKHRISEQPSDYSTALLGLPPRGGYLVKASVHFRTDVVGQDAIDTGYPGTAIEFEWLYPTEEQLAEMRQRLKQLLQEPKNRAYHAYILNALLKVPEVAEAAPTTAMLDALQRRKEPFEGREYLADSISERFATDPDVIKHFRQRLLDGDQRAIEDLVRAKKVWSNELLEPLLTLFEGQSRGRRTVITMIAERHMGERPDPAVAKRLSRAWLRDARYLDKQPQEVDRDYRPLWAWELTALGQTRDMEMLPRIVPLLDDKTRVYPEGPTSRATSVIPPTRACDAALVAISYLLDGKAAGQVSSFDVQNRVPRTPDMTFRTRWKLEEEGAAAIRDKMIAAMKKRLTERDSNEGKSSD